MNPKKISRRQFSNSMAAVAASLLGSGILFNLPSYASVDTKKCPAKLKGIPNLVIHDQPIPVSDLPFFGAGGKEISLKDYRGRGVLLNFWATWCPPCVREMPQLNNLKAILKNQGIDVLTVSIDREGEKIIREFLFINNLNNLEVLHDRKGKLLRASKIIGLPGTLLISPEGKEMGRVLGAAEWDEPTIVNYLKKCLAPKTV